MTYLDLYLDGLYARLETGGAQASIDAAVDEINVPTPAGFAAFIAPVRELPCGACGAPFVRPEAVPTLTEEVLCSACKLTTNPA